MNFRSKEYKVVIWDWLWTLYSRKDRRLFRWVKPYFDKYGKDSTNYLVSYALNPSKRIKLISEFGLDIYFKEILVSVNKKEEIYRDILMKNDIRKEDILVIGDNVLHEGRAAKELGLDFIPISVWDEYVYPSLSFGRKEE